MELRDALVIASMLAAAGIAGAQTSSLFVGPSGESWSNALNWDPAVVPANGGGRTYSVTIPTGKLVYQDLPGLTIISELSLEPGTTLALPGTQLSVLGVALLEDTLILADGAGAAFTTSAPFTSGSSQRVQVNNGAQVSLAVPTYFWSEDLPGETLMLASDAGSAIVLDGTTEIDATAASTGGTSYSYDLIARSGGLLDFSDVTTVNGAGGNERLRFRAEPGGTIDLSSLEQFSEGLTWLEPAGGEFLLDSLQSASGTRIGPLAEGTVLNLPSLTSLVGSSIEVDEVAFISAPQLTSFVDSSLTLNRPDQLSVPSFDEIDNSRFDFTTVRLTVDDTDYYWTHDWQGATLFLGKGSTTFLLASLTLIDASAASTGGTAYSYDFEVRDDSTIWLSELTTLIGAGGNERLRFRAVGNGWINLQSLTEATEGNTWFDLDGGSIDLSSLATLENGRITVPFQNTFELPSLTAARATVFEIGSGGTVDAPLLTDIERSSITLTPTTTLNAPLFEEIDDALITIAEGREFAVADTDYFWTQDRTGATPLRVTDPGSLFDLSSVETLDATAASTGGTSYTYALEATNFGVMDLSGVTDARGAGGNEWLSVLVSDGGTVLLGGLTQTDGRLALSVANPQSVIEIAGDLSLGIEGGQAGIRAELRGEFRAAGDWIYRLNGGFHDAGGGSIHLVSDTGQAFEVAGADLGLPDDTVSDNYEWGSMVVGRDAQATIVALTDSQDNGNRGQNGEPEALYLVGLPQGDEGLSIRGGSTLILNDLQLYVDTTGGWVHINALFGPDDFVIPYDGGFIQIRDCRADWNGDGNVNTQDFLAYLNAWSSGDASADLNGDGTVNTLDFLAFLGLWSAGCG